MDNIPEREQPKAERIIQLDEEFYPFDFSKTKRLEFPITIYDSLFTANFGSYIILNLKDDLKIPFGVLARRGSAEKATSITPFDPKLGYQIDSSDLELDTRIKKVERLRAQGEIIDFSKASHSIHFFSDRYFFPSQGVLDLSKKLRLYLFFPESRYESRPNPYGLASSDFRTIDFFSSYPIDSKPLPNNDPPEEPRTYDDFLMRDGLDLYVPPDLEKLAQIRARFVMAEEQPEDS